MLWPKKAKGGSRRGAKAWSSAAIRTGPGDFNRVLVTNRWYGGACPENRKVAGGRVWHLGTEPAQQRALAAMPASRFAPLAERGTWPHVRLIETPTEEDLFNFKVLHVPYWPPQARTEARIREFLRQR